jgi:hypothetical protein
MRIGEKHIGENLSDTELLWIMATIANKEKGGSQKGHLYELK